MSKKTFNSTNFKKLLLPKDDSKAGYILYRHDSYSPLLLKVTKKGTRTFMVSFPDGSRKSIGKYIPDEFGISQAREKAEEKILAFRKGLPLEEHQASKDTIQIPTFLDMTNKYLEWAKNHKKESTIESDRSRLKIHVLPTLGNMPVDKITTRDISALLDKIKGSKSHKYTYIKSVRDIYIKNITQEDFIIFLKDLKYKGKPEINIEEYGQDKIYNALLFHIEDQKIVDKYFKKHAEYYSVKKPCGPGTANRVKATLSHMFNSAMMWPEPEWECIKSNPCTGIKSTQPKAKTRYLDRDELDRVYDVLETDEYKGTQIAFIIRFLLATGARKSEALNAKWEHFDFNRSIWRRPDNNSKTKLAPTIPLAPPAIRVLKEMSKLDNKGYLFKSEINPNKPVSEFRRSFKTVLKKAEVENCSPHDLRRIFGSQLLLNGTDMKTVSMLLGHNKVSTTERHYAFLNLETLHSAVDVLDGIMR